MPDSPKHVTLDVNIDWHNDAVHIVEKSVNGIVQITPHTVSLPIDSVMELAAQLIMGRVQQRRAAMAKAAGKHGLIVPQPKTNGRHG